MVIPLLAVSGAVPVRLVGTAGHWQLLRDGRPYRIRGAGGSAYLDKLAAAGANSVRTWGAEQLPKLLPEANRYGLTVAAGIWLQHPSELDYEDMSKVAKQAEEVRAQVIRYRNDPAILMWGIGNEMEAGDGTAAIWRGVEEALKAAKLADPNHPVMTVVAEVSQRKIANILKYAPDVDILGINSYGGLVSLAARLKAYGWTKPYIVTEFGPIGHWECGKTAWGAPIEATSTEKAAVYAKGYQASIASEPAWCLGSYAFLWGNKQEVTPTWFGMLLPSGEPLAAVDVMQQAWTGHAPVTSAPVLDRFELDGDHARIRTGSTLHARVKARGDGLTYAWAVLPEVGERKPDGKGEAELTPVGVTFTPPEGPDVSFSAPTQPGDYRLYVTVRSSAHRAATANIPFQVQ